MSKQQKNRFKEMKRKIKELQKVIDEGEKGIVDVNGNPRYIDLNTRYKKGIDLTELECKELNGYYIELQEKYKKLTNAYDEQTALYLKEMDDSSKIATLFSIISFVFALGALVCAIIKILV